MYVQRIDTNRQCSEYFGKQMTHISHNLPPVVYEWAGHASIRPSQTTRQATAKPGTTSIVNMKCPCSWESDFLEPYPIWAPHVLETLLACVGDFTGAILYWWQMGAEGQFTIPPPPPPAS